MGVLVIGYDENENYVPLRVPGAKYEKVVHLFYFSDGEKSHYACVGSISCLLSSSISKINQKVNICHYCLSLVSKIGLEEHVRFCSKHEPMKVTMPEEGEKCYFKDYKSTMWLPVVIYADFETLHKKVDETHGQTKLISKHIPCAYSIVVVSDLPNFQMEPISYVGENAERKFVKDLEDIRDKFHNKFARSRKMIFGSEERAKYDLQKECFACGEEFTFNHEKGCKVRDHCHFTGKFRGALHNVCNLKAKRSWRIPIFFHNLSSFDSHLFVKELSDDGNTNVNAIPENEQRYISFEKR